MFLKVANTTRFYIRKNRIDDYRRYQRMVRLTNTLLIPITHEQCNGSLQIVLHCSLPTTIDETLTLLRVCRERRRPLLLGPGSFMMVLRKYTKSRPLI